MAANGPDIRRVVVTGMGIVSSIGDTIREVSDSLKIGRSGITFSQDYADKGFKSQVYGKPNANPADHVDKRAMRFMGDGAGWCHMAMTQAIADAGLEQSHITNPRTGLIVGTGGPSTRAIVEAADSTREKGSPRRVGPFAVPKAMSSTASATLSTLFKILGVNYSISSACTTSLHCVGAATEQIQWGKQDVMFAGGGEELDWTLSALFDGLGAMSSKYNAEPHRASRAFDADRDGFVIAGGAGMLVLEEYEHAKRRGATIYGEVVGYGATSDGHDMVAPSGRRRCPRHATRHGASRRRTRLPQPARHLDAGRRRERAGSRPRRVRPGSLRPADDLLHQVDDRPLARRRRRAGADLLADHDEGEIRRSFHQHRQAGSACLRQVNIIREAREAVIKMVMSNSFGFGGTNGSVMVAKV